MLKIWRFLKISDNQKFSISFENLVFFFNFENLNILESLQISEQLKVSENLTIPKNEKIYENLIISEKLKISENVKILKNSENLKNSEKLKNSGNLNISIQQFKKAGQKLNVPRRREEKRRRRIPPSLWPCCCAAGKNLEPFRFIRIRQIRISGFRDPFFRIFRSRSILRAPKTLLLAKTIYGPHLLFLAYFDWTPPSWGYPYRYSA